MLHLENHGEEAKDYDLNGLGQQPMPWRLHDELQKGNLPNTIRDVVQANHRNGAPGIDKSRRMIRG